MFPVVMTTIRSDRNPIRTNPNTIGQILSQVPCEILAFPLRQKVTCLEFVSAIFFRFFQTGPNGSEEVQTLLKASKIFGKLRNFSRKRGKCSFLFVSLRFGN